ncbi:hypothetical protein ACHAXT_006151 [Thalassiosira profunda]
MISKARLLLLVHLLAAPFAASVGLLRGGAQDLAPGAVEGGDPAWNNSTGHLAGDDVQPRSNHISALKQPRIIGGTTASDDRYSYMVALVDGSGLFCGGVLICQDMVLTAAHCPEKKEVFEMFVGSSRLSDRFGSEGEVVTHSEEFVHPRYDWKTMENDVAIYKLETPVSVDVEVIRVNSNNGAPSSPGKRLVALGWGDQDPDPFRFVGSDELMSAGVNFIPNEECNEREGYVGQEYVGYEGQVKDSMMCALGNGKDGCQGDSGGPLIDEGDNERGRQDTLMGLSSWGVACAHATLPGVYTRVSSEYPWIKSIVCEHSAKPAASFGCSRGGNSDATGDSNGNSMGGNNGRPSSSNNRPSNKQPAKRPGKKNKGPGKKGKKANGKKKKPAKKRPAKKKDPGKNKQNGKNQNGPNKGKRPGQKKKRPRMTDRWKRQDRFR